MGIDSDVVEEDKRARTENAELRIINLRKRFFGGHGWSKYAVDGLSLNASEGSVLALLGHNGAGKTTTINVLTGLLRASSGDAILYGHNVSEEMEEIQRLIGVCPQNNILWEELTAREHMEIFAGIKNVPKESENEQIENALKSVLLLDVADKQSGKFSGGMKRRLSVAIASIGNPRVLYLDEPTTGLDPMSRREIWSSIQRMKKGRIIVLTTHSMEEADVLGDRVAIMSHGKLRCIGTSLHLKNKYGLGYRLNLVTLPFTQGKVKELVIQMIAAAQLIAETGVNLMYGIRSQDLQQIIPFFQMIEQNQNNPNFFIKDWGMSQTTLEEVFLKITHMHKEV